MQNPLTPIATIYKDQTFRSRLEARWAVYFDCLGIEWQYEPEAYNLDGLCYLPDFWLPQVKMWAEVKPEPFSDQEKEKLRRLVMQSGRPGLMLVGVPDHQSYDAIEPDMDDVMDYIVTAERLCENRFFASTGCSNKAEFQECYQLDEDVADAILKARTYKFW